MNIEVAVHDPVELEVTGHNGQTAEVSSRIVINHIDGGLPPGGVQGDILIKRSSEERDAEWIAPANSAEQDNTRPITSAAVYTEIGNINALLATI